jgi:hypothetical protein
MPDIEPTAELHEGFSPATLTLAKKVLGNPLPRAEQGRRCA